MTVTAAMISQVSEYEVSDSKPFKPALFTALQAVAAGILAADDPKNLLPSSAETGGISVRDYCHALLIAHLYAIKQGKTGYQSEAMQGYSVTRKLGETAYSIQYRDILKTFASTSTSRLDSDRFRKFVLRADAKMPDFNLDQAETPIFFEDELDNADLRTV
jgi:hypothetical protein